MAVSLNKAIIIGNLGKDPEIRYTQDGKEIAHFSVATSENWRDKNSGDKKEKVEWHKVVVFHLYYINIIRNAHKGSRIYVEGPLQTRKWNDNQGVERYVTEIVVQQYNGNIILLDQKESVGGGSYFEDDSSNKDTSKQFSSNFQNNKKTKRFDDMNKMENEIEDIEDDKIPF
jgi:single-strand DNA-binding protein